MIFTFLDYARLVHPVQEKIPNSVLNNAIGNVFATEKRKQERRDMDKYNSNEMDDHLEDDEDTHE